MTGIGKTLGQGNENSVQTFLRAIIDVIPEYGVIAPEITVITASLAAFVGTVRAVRIGTLRLLCLTPGPIVRT